MKIGSKYYVVKGGVLDVNGPIKFKRGEIWDIVASNISSPQLRKLNNNGSSTRLLNGQIFARAGIESEKFVELDSDDPRFIEHNDLIKRTGAQGIEGRNKSE